MAKKAATIKAATKGEVYTKLAGKTGLTKKQVSSVFDALTEMIGNELGKKGPGLFQMPGLLKLKVVRKPATKAKQGINPFTKAPMMYKAKPAQTSSRLCRSSRSRRWSETHPWLTPQVSNPYRDNTRSTRRARKSSLPPSGAVESELRPVPRDVPPQAFFNRGLGGITEFFGRPIDRRERLVHVAWLFG